LSYAASFEINSNWDFHLYLLSYLDTSGLSLKYNIKSVLKIQAFWMLLEGSSSGIVAKTEVFSLFMVPLLV
jgi:hypothetical protein